MKFHRNAETIKANKHRCSRSLITAWTSLVLAPATLAPAAIVPAAIVQTAVAPIVYTPAACAADASQSSDPSQKSEKEPFKVDSKPPDMVVDERTEIEMLRDLGDSLRKLDHAATETVKEVNRHAPAPIGMQDIVAEQIVNPFGYDPWDPALNASLRTGPLLPPRKKWLDIDVSQVGQIAGILQQEVTSLCPPVAMSNTAKDSFKVELGLMTEANGKIQDATNQLKQLAQGPNYDNDKIGKAAHDIRTSAKTIEECRKRAVRALAKK